MRLRSLIEQDLERRVLTPNDAYFHRSRPRHDASLVGLRRDDSCRHSLALAEGRARHTRYDRYSCRTADAVGRIFQLTLLLLSLLSATVQPQRRRRTKSPQKSRLACSPLRAKASLLVRGWRAAFSSPSPTSSADLSVSSLRSSCWRSSGSGNGWTSAMTLVCGCARNYGSCSSVWATCAGFIAPTPFTHPSNRRTCDVAGSGMIVQNF